VIGSLVAAVWSVLGFSYDDIVVAMQDWRLAQECARAFRAEGRAPFGILESPGEGEHLTHWFISDDAAALLDRHGIQWRRFLVRTQEAAPPAAHPVVVQTG
jgi:hypothetical protein